jgi:hypothetical protein
MSPDSEQAFVQAVLARGLADPALIRELVAARAKLAGRKPSLAKLLCSRAVLGSADARTILRHVRAERTTGRSAGPRPPSEATPLGVSARSIPDEGPPLGIRFDSSSSQPGWKDSDKRTPGSPDPLRIGGRLGPYEIQGELGRGGMGIVYRGVDTRLGRPVALKTLLGKASAVRLERFRREGRALARIRHPGIVTLYEADVYSGVPLVALELIEGGSLRQRLAREGPLEPRAAAAIVRDLALAVAAAHAEGIIHRDLKPANVLVEKDGRPRLTDFGLARDEIERTITLSGEVLGTLEYMAPEQVLGCNELVGPRTDVYGLGAVLYATLTGQPPYRAFASAELMRLIVSSAPERPSLRRGAALSRVPEALEAICFRALAKDPGDRYPSAEALAADLERHLAGEAVVARAPGSARRRLRYAAALALTAGASLLGWSAVEEALGRRDREAARSACAEAREALEQALRNPKAGAARCRAGFASAARAANRAREADRRGAAGADTLANEASGLMLELAKLAAARALEAGSPEDALAAVDALPGAPASLPPEARLLRARALLGLHRFAEAADDAVATGRAAGPALATQALELEGDACLAGSLVPRAALAFGRALDRHPPNAADLRRKRAIAAALSGDDATALADLALLHPGPGDIGDARLAPLAPALYRRGLASSGAARARDLGRAAALGPAPPELAGSAARAWLELCNEDAKPLIGFDQVEMLGDADARIDTYVAVFERAARVRAMSPAAIPTPFGDLLRSFVAMSWRYADGGSISPKLRAGFDRLAAAWPEEPTFLCLKSAYAQGDAVSELLARVLDLLPPATSDESDARALHLADLTLRRIGERPTRAEDIERITRTARRLSGVGSWARAMSIFARGGFEAPTLDAMARMRECFEPGASPDLRLEFEGEALDALRVLDRPEAALTLARRNHAEFKSDVSRKQLVNVLSWTHHAQEAVDLSDFEHTSDPVLLEHAGFALIELDRIDEARAVLARIDSSVPKRRRALADALMLAERKRTSR